MKYILLSFFALASLDAFGNCKDIQIAGQYQCPKSLSGEAFELKIVHEQKKGRFHKFLFEIRVFNSFVSSRKVSVEDRRKGIADGKNGLYAYKASCTQSNKLNIINYFDLGDNELYEEVEFYFLDKKLSLIHI